MPRKESAITSRLPELPPDLASRLRQVGTSALLAAVPEVADPSPPVTDAPQPLLKKISEYTVTEYYTMAAYPIVVCFPPDFADVVFAPLVSDEQQRGVKGAQFTALRANASGISDYKLTTDSAGKPFYNPFWCRVFAHYSLAPVKRTTSCIDGVPPKWELEIAGIPSGPSLISWYGDWADMPSVPNLDVITTHLIQHAETTYCCPGFRPCASTGGCLDITIDCQDDIVPI